MDFIPSTKTNLIIVVILAVALCNTNAVTNGKKNCPVDEQTRTINCSNLGLETIKTFPKSDAFVLKLDLSCNKLTVLESNTFAALTNTLLLDPALESINYPGNLASEAVIVRDLSENKLTALPGRLFNALTQLKILDLSKNQLTSLPNGLLNALTQLQTLKLHTNNITTLDVGIFDRLTKLVILYLSRNKLEDLDGSIFDSLVSLKVLYLSYNNLEDLDGSIFDSLVSLQILDLKKMALENLVPGIFKSLSKLGKLFLNINQMMALLPGIFDNLVKLQTLSVSGNKFTGLPVEVFDSLESLASFYLYDNPLTSLDYSMFDDMRNLKKLILPPMCNCTENTLSMIPFLENFKHDVRIIINLTDHTAKWIELTTKCKSDWIDHPYCDNFREDVTTRSAVVSITAKPQEWSEWESLVDCSASCGKGIQLQTRSRYVQCYGDYVSEVKTLECHGKNCNGSALVWNNWYENMKSNEHLKIEMEEELEAIRKELAIDKSQTTAAVRRRTSARDYRMSSTVMGGVAALIVLIPVMFAVCSDVCPCAPIQLMNKRRKRRTRPS